MNTNNTTLTNNKATDAARLYEILNANGLQWILSSLADSCASLEIQSKACNRDIAAACWALCADQLLDLASEVAPSTF